HSRLMEDAAGLVELVDAGELLVQDIAGEQAEPVIGAADQLAAGGGIPLPQPPPKSLQMNGFVTGPVGDVDTTAMRPWVLVPVRNKDCNAGGRRCPRISAPACRLQKSSKLFV